MKSDYELWIGAVSHVAASWEVAKIMPVDTEPNRISRGEAFRTAGALIMQLEFLARLSIIGPDGKSIGMKYRLENLMSYAKSLYKGPSESIPLGTIRMIDLGNPLTGGAAAMELYGERSQDAAHAADIEPGAGRDAG